MIILPKSLHIGVLRGGTSPEYPISLQTGAHVIEVLSQTHKPIDILITKDGKWHMNGVERSPERILKHVDVIFNALHGEYGEDGKVQDFLNHHGVPYTGSDKIESSIAMNKWLTKEQLKKYGIKTPVGALVRREDNIEEKAREIWSSLPHPFIVKPTCGGSSIGVYIAKNFDELLATLTSVLEVHGSAVVEEYIEGKQASCGVIDNYRNKDVYVLPTVEIVPKDGKIFDYNAKYSGESKEVSPGNFSAKEKKELEYLSELAHRVLGLSHYSRSDFIVSPRRGVYFLEVNTLPGLTKNSLFPKSLESVGIKVQDFLHHIVGLALNRK